MRRYAAILLAPEVYRLRRRRRVIGLAMAWVTDTLPGVGQAVV
jgi:hypothetical protein